MLRDERDFRDFMDHFKAGDFDDHLFDTIGRLSANDLTRIAEALEMEEFSRSHKLTEISESDTVISHQAGYAVRASERTAREGAAPE